MYLQAPSAFARDDALAGNICSAPPRAPPRRTAVCTSQNIGPDVIGVLLPEIPTNLLPLRATRVWAGWFRMDNGDVIISRCGLLLWWLLLCGRTMCQGQHLLEGLVLPTLFRVPKIRMRWAARSAGVSGAVRGMLSNM